MLFELFKLPWSAIKDGNLHGYPVSRNPLLWILYFLALPVLVVIWLLFSGIYILLMPLMILGSYLGLRSFQRRVGVFSDAGIHFPKANGLTIKWSEIREVVREREPKVIFYRVTLVDDTEHVLSWTQDDDAFESTLGERNTPFRARDYLDRTATGRS